MNRRNFMVTGVGLGMLAAGPALADKKQSGAAAKAQPQTPRDTLVATTSECVQKGALCSAHCAEELAKGNTSMAHCAESVEEMRSFVQAMLTLAARGSAMAKKLAPVCAEACKSCADACLEHKAHWEHGMHLVCKSCMEACLACEKACSAYVAA